MRPVIQRDRCHDCNLFSDPRPGFSIAFSAEVGIIYFDLSTQQIGVLVPAHDLHDLVVNSHGVR